MIPAQQCPQHVGERFEWVCFGCVCVCVWQCEKEKEKEKEREYEHLYWCRPIKAVQRDGFVIKVRQVEQERIYSKQRRWESWEFQGSCIATQEVKLQTDSGHVTPHYIIKGQTETCWIKKKFLHRSLINYMKLHFTDSIEMRFATTQATLNEASRWSLWGEGADKLVVISKIWQRPVSWILIRTHWRC